MGFMEYKMVNMNSTGQYLQTMCNENSRRQNYTYPVITVCQSLNRTEKK